MHQNFGSDHGTAVDVRAGDGHGEDGWLWGTGSSFHLMCRYSQLKWLGGRGRGVALLLARYDDEKGVAEDQRTTACCERMHKMHRTGGAEVFAPAVGAAEFAVSDS